MQKRQSSGQQSLKTIDYNCKSDKRSEHVFKIGTRNHQQFLKPFGFTGERWRNAPRAAVLEAAVPAEMYCAERQLEREFTGQLSWIVIKIKPSAFRVL